MAWLPLTWGLVVDSANTVLFWLVPIFYPFSVIPLAYREVYQFNPVAALVLAMQNILMYRKTPPASLLWKLCFSSLAVLGAGWLVFQALKRRFYDYF